MTMACAALCLTSFLGMKDTGIFVKEHVQTTYSGNKVYFQAGETANVIEKVKDGYIVAKGNAKVTVPEEKIELTEIIKKVYKVIKNTSFKEEDNSIIRNLFLGETVTLVSEAKDYIKVIDENGIVGKVSKDALEVISTDVIKREPTRPIENNTNVIKVFDNVEDELRNIATLKVDTMTQKVQQPQLLMTQENKIIKPQDSNSSLANRAISSALDKLGSTYIYGATGNGGYDCSGLIYSVYKNELGINLPRSSSEQSGYGKQISRNELVPGDLIFFNTTGGGVSHVGIYIGNNEFVHASSGKGKVIVSSLSENYYNSRYVNATRVL